MKDSSFWQLAKAMETGDKVLAITLTATLAVFVYKGFSRGAASGVSIADLWLWLAFAGVVAVVAWFVTGQVENGVAHKLVALLVTKNPDLVSWTMRRPHKLSLRKQHRRDPLPVERWSRLGGDAAIL